MSTLWHWIIALTFKTPWLFWVAWLTPFAVGLLHVYDRARRKALMSRLGELPVVSRVMATMSPGRRVLKDAFAAAGLTLVLLAVARPQLEGKRKVELRGLDLVVAVDVSKSMLVDDVGPTAEMTRKKLPTNRLERARELAAGLISQLPGDRVAPIVFAGAVSHFPLIEDAKVATDFLNDLGPGDLPQGSNLGEAFRVSLCVLRPDAGKVADCAKIVPHGHGGDPLGGESLDPKVDKTKDDLPIVEQKTERGKAIVIFTDGGEPDAQAIAAVHAARELGIAVFLVGVGTETGGIVYDIDATTGKRTTTPRRTADGATVMSRREDRGLRSLAAAGGDESRYMVAAERGELDPMPLVQKLRAVNRGLATKNIKENKDVFEPFVFAGLMLLVIEAAIGTRRRRTYPEAP